MKKTKKKSKISQRERERRQMQNLIDNEIHVRPDKHGQQTFVHTAPDGTTKVYQ